MNPARPPRVLVADDDAVIRLLAVERLAHCGAETVQACDGEEAVQLACGTAFDLILMDLHMPGLDGLAATAEIRRFEQRHARVHVPVVAFTSSHLRHDQRLLHDMGFDAVLEKPAEHFEVQACLARWCPTGNGGVTNGVTNGVTKAVTGAAPDVAANPGAPGVRARWPGPHHYRVIDVRTSDRSVALRDPAGHYHVACAMGDLPAVDQELEGPAPALGAARLVAPGGRVLPVMFDRVNASQVEVFTRLHTPVSA